MILEVKCDCCGKAVEAELEIIPTENPDRGLMIRGAHILCQGCFRKVFRVALDKADRLELDRA